MAKPAIASFAEFWPYYLGEHRLATTRRFHFIGTSLFLLAIGLGMTVGPWWLVLTSPGAGYGMAWISHFFIEKNRPATFRYPGWSLRADLVMWAYMLTGRLDAELRRTQAPLVAAGR